VGRPLAGALLALTLGLSVPGAPLDRDAIREVADAARRAHEEKDYASFLRLSESLVRLAPRSARAVYNLACARSLTEDAEGAVVALAQLADWGVAFDIEADADFASIRNLEGFRAVAARMHALDERVGASPVAFSIAQKDLLAEGVAYDAKTGAFFVTSVHRRKIVRLDATGHATDFVPEGRDGLLSAVGIVADPPRRALWVTTEASRLMTGFREEDEGPSLLLELDLDDASLRRRFGPPVPGGRVSDLALAPDGTIYVADPAGGRVYRLTPGAERLEVLVDEGTLASPQGLAVTGDGRLLFVADYVQGVARVDLASAAVRFLETPEDLLVSGIDGLVLAGDSLVGIQNGIRPNRVLRLRLDAGGSRVLEGAILERAHPRFDEPTLGVVVDDALYYVANSQYRLFGRDGTPDLENLQDPVILRLPLPWLSGR
jgi:sugar lactone lactonase YvrE